jgi:predicted transcriptional regulator
VVLLGYHFKEYRIWYLMDLWKKIWMSEGEGKVYEAILKTETASVQKIHELVGIERRNVYDIINKLIAKGLVTYTTENRKKVYHVTHPNKIVEYLDEKQGDIVEAKKELEKELPALVKTYENTKSEVSFQVYRGKEGMKALYEEFLTEKHNYFIGANFAIKKYLGNFWTRWNARRTEKKVFWHDIVTAKTYDMDLPMYFKDEKLKHYEFKVLPREFDSPHFIVVYGNKVGNLLWSEPFFAFVIESEQVARNYMDYFHFLWKRLPKPRDK